MDIEVLLTLGKSALLVWCGAAAFLLWICTALSARLSDAEELLGAPATRRPLR